ncbi:MAG: hypothetical protein LBE59_09970 [Nevskiaceae bacterium]|jgi:hypothetical protein|nr:hypothetical protein [Nevskiaceae bacterium]
MIGRTGMLLLLSLLALCACAVSPDRPAQSSLGCMRAVRDALPDNISDARAHCLAAGGIAQRCSGVEARVSAAGKELADVFTSGDASWADWRADRAGMRCARELSSQGDGGQDALAACCAQAGF